VLQAILEPVAPLKIGFGLSDDVKRVYQTRHPRGGMVDLSVALREPGQRNDLGAKTAVAKFLARRCRNRKDLRHQLGLPHLNEKQILYAADDAQVALRIYQHVHASWAANCRR
jgi:RNA polymerase sigma factor for flagellar operon FliA